LNDLPYSKKDESSWSECKIDGRENMVRPRIADDFAAIRARMEEMGRESAEVSAEPDARPATGQNSNRNLGSKLEGHYCGLNGRRSRSNQAVAPAEPGESWLAPLKLSIC
jgi:hypothetical protein